MRVDTPKQSSSPLQRKGNQPTQVFFLQAPLIYSYSAVTTVDFSSLLHAYSPGISYPIMLCYLAELAKLRRRLFSAIQCSSELKENKYQLTSPNRHLSCPYIGHINRRWVSFYLRRLYVYPKLNIGVR